MPPTLGLVAAAILGVAIFAVAWWNRQQVRLDAPARFDPVAEAEQILREVS